MTNVYAKKVTLPDGSSFWERGMQRMRLVR